MGWGILGDIVDAVVDVAEDGVDALEDAVDAGLDAIEDAARAIEEALDLALDAIEDAIEDVGDALGELGEDIADVAEGAWDTFEELAQDAWETVASGVEEAWEELSELVEDAWEAASGVVEDAIDELGDFVEDAWNALEDTAAAAWNAVENAAEDAWERTVAAVEGAAGALANMVELSVEIMDRVVEFIVDAAKSAWVLIKQLGACLGGIVILKLVKLDNAIENFWKVPKLLPASYRQAIEPLFGDRSFWNVWYIDDARLAADWYNDTTDAMTMSGVTIGGATLSHLIYLTDSWDPADASDRELMAHELVHVVQYRRLVTDQAFGCAYGVGYMKADFDYRKNAMEAVAYDFTDRNRALIAV